MSVEERGAFPRRLKADGSLRPTAVVTISDSWAERRSAFKLPIDQLLIRLEAELDRLRARNAEERAAMNGRR